MKLHCVSKPCLQSRRPLGQHDAEVGEALVNAERPDGLRACCFTDGVLSQLGARRVKRCGRGFRRTRHV